MTKKTLKKKEIDINNKALKTTRRKKPGPGRPTREQARLRNIELLDRALDLFLEKGFERTTMEAIAASVGMAKRTVYAQYGDKKTLFKASLNRAIDDWIIPVEELHEAESQDLEQTLFRIGKILVDNMLTPAGLRLLRITNAEANRMPEISIYTNEQGTGPTLRYLADLFRRRITPETGDMPDADEAALAFLYLVVGGPASMTVWGLPFDKNSLDKHTEYCVRMFMNGVFSEKLR